MHAAPSGPKESMIKVAVPAGIVAALMWLAAHLAMHRPRGWPFPFLGEWDLLLTSGAVAAGTPPPAVLGAVQGGDIGTYLVALCAALPIALGMDPVLAGKLVGAGFGAAAAGFAASWAALMAAHDFEVHEGTPDAGTGAWTAALVTACFFATAWPGLHFELAGMNGRTPEALALQLPAIFLAMDLRHGGRFGSAAAAGFFAGVAVLLSPVALWTVGTVAVVIAVYAKPRTGTWSRPERAGLVGVMGAGVLAGIVGCSLLLPRGLEGLALFFRATFLDAFLASGGTGASGPGPWGIARLLFRSLEGGAHSPDLEWRPTMLAVAAGLLVVAAVSRIILSRMFRELDDSYILGFVALSWIVPLSLLPLDRWEYPLAYRYWFLPIGLCAVMLGAETGRWVGTQKIGSLANVGAVAIGGFFLSGLIGIQNSIVAPPPSRADALVAAGAHRMGPREGYDRHATFLALADHLPASDRAPLLEGYGMFLGGDAASDARDGREVVHEWEALTNRWGNRERSALLIGVGCGATTFPAVPARLIQSWIPAVADQEHLLYGVGLCTAEPGRPRRPDLSDALGEFRALQPAAWRAFGEGLRDAGLAPAELDRMEFPETVRPRVAAAWEQSPRHRDRRSTVPRPASLMPLRW